MADPFAFLAGHALDAAPRLLGAIVSTDLPAGAVSVRITEVEAYGGVGEDPGSHAFRRETPRNAVMFGPAGRLYVYFTYGMHWCANVVTGQEGIAGAVLLRAGEVVEGIEHARARRPRSSDRDLARGPARLAKALGIDGECNGVDLRTSSVRLTPATTAGNAAVSPRTGVSGDGAHHPWRFFIPDDPHVSPYRPAPARRLRSTN